MKTVLLATALLLGLSAARAQTAPSRLLSGEEDNAAMEEAFFPQLAAVRQVDARTARTGEASVRLAAWPQSTLLSSARIPVHAGQRLTFEVYAHYTGATPRNWVRPAAQALASSLVIGTAPTPPGAVNEAPPTISRRTAPFVGLSLVWALPHLFHRRSRPYPLAYVAYNLYDRDGAYRGGERLPVTAAARDAWQQLQLTVIIPATGFIELVLGNATPTNVWFDDLRVQFNEEALPSAAEPSATDSLLGLVSVALATASSTEALPATLPVRNVLPTAPHHQPAHVEGRGVPTPRQHERSLRKKIAGAGGRTTMLEDPDDGGDEPGLGFPGNPDPYPLDPVTVTPDPDPTPPPVYLPPGDNPDAPPQPQPGDPGPSGGGGTPAPPTPLITKAEIIVGECTGLQKALSAQADNHKEEAGYTTSDGKVILLPMDQNTDASINVSFPLHDSDGHLVTNGPFEEDGVWKIDMNDWTDGHQVTEYTISYAFHTHPIGTAPNGNTYLPDSPSSADYTNAANYPGLAEHIVNAQNTVVYDTTHVISTSANPCH